MVSDLEYCALEDTEKIKNIFKLAFLGCQMSKVIHLLSQNSYKFKSHNFSQHLV